MQQPWLFKPVTSATGEAGDGSKKRAQPQYCSLSQGESSGGNE